MHNSQAFAVCMQLLESNNAQQAHVIFTLHQCVLREDCTSAVDPTGGSGHEWCYVEVRSETLHPLVGMSICCLRYV